MPSRRIAYDMRANPPAKIAGPSARKAHLMEKIIRSGSSCNVAMCSPSPQSAEMVTKIELTITKPCRGRLVSFARLVL